MKRIANRRAGDRAEAFGVVVMQSFCAVAPVPRQEDFGLVDAVATILRPHERFVYAEDSFSVQFKSRTERQVEYLGERFDALLNQDLGLFIARVDLTQGDLKLYSLAPALLHPNINDMKGLVVYLDPHPMRFDDQVLHTSLGPPVLHLRSADLEDKEMQTKAYQVMKRWLELDRWNRRYRKMGIQIQVLWETNEVPTQGASSLLWNPERADVALTEVVPAIQLIGGLAFGDSRLAVPVIQLISWMRSQGVDPDPTGTVGLGAWFKASQEQMQEELHKQNQANVVMRIEFVTNEAGRYSFWERVGGHDGPWTGRRHDCSNVDEVRALGFDIEVDEDTREIGSIGLSQRWLAERHCELVEVRENIFLLRRHHTEGPDGGDDDG